MNEEKWLGWWIVTTPQGKTWVADHYEVTHTKIF